MKADLTDETTLLLREVDTLIANDHFFLSQRIETLRAIRAKLRPEPVASPCCRWDIPSRRALRPRKGG